MTRAIIASRHFARSSSVSVAGDAQRRDHRVLGAPRLALLGFRGAALLLLQFDALAPGLGVRQPAALIPGLARLGLVVEIAPERSNLLGEPALRLLVNDCGRVEDAD